MTSDELMAAAERWRAKRDTPGAHGLPPTYSHRESDMRKLSDAWCAEHPADSGVAVDEAWLLSVGFARSTAGWLSILTPLGGRLDCSIGGGKPLWDFHDESIVPPKTRGDVRRLCAALGITLTEQPQ